MIGKLLKRTLLMLGAMVIFISSVNSQTLQDMTVSFSNTTFTPTTPQYSAGPADDNVVSVTIPFNFQYDGQSSNNIYMSANGFICFYPFSSYGYYSSPLTGMYPGVAAMRCDLYVWGTIQIGLEGVAPNRVVVFQWNQADWYYQNNANMNFQIRCTETTNQIDIVYGSMNVNNTYNTSGGGPYIGFTGRSTSSYINIEPKAGDWVAHFSSKNPTPNYANSYCQNVSVLNNVTNGKTVSLTAFPSMADVYPRDGVIFGRGNVYTGDQHPAIWVNRMTGQPDIYAYYKISGPLPGTNPDYKTIYTACNADPMDELYKFNPQPDGKPGKATINKAKGIAAGPNGEFDLLTNETQIPGGEYTLETEMVLPSFNYFQTWPTQTFVIALENDLAVTAINAPANRNTRKYPQTASIYPSCRVQNIGITPVFEYGVKCNIYDESGSIVYTDSNYWNSAAPLTTGQYNDEVFTRFTSRTIGNYEVVYYVTLLSAEDDELINNRIPRAANADYFFEIAYELEGEVAGIFIPGDTLYVKRPVLPNARFKNNGVSVISEWPAKIAIMKINGLNYDTVYTDNIIIEDIPEGRMNIADYVFSKNFIPETPGQYMACVSISSNDDPVASNNTFCKTFTVIDAMAGTYTIGTTYGGPRNFATLTAALDALYLKGVTGPVVFEFTDANYNLGDINQNGPAFDISSNIIGVSATNTITFRPSSVRGVNKGAITLNLYSGSGVGILVGQNLNPTNNNAAVYNVTPSLKKTYAKADGYIIFDGGAQKAIKLKLNTNSQFRAAVYLTEGSNNITFKNLLIEDATPNKTAFTIPLTKYDVQLQKFLYEPNSRPNSVTYSNGILMRAMPPFDKNTTDANTFKLDTSVISNCTITNNEIQGFGIGISDIGIGVLKDANANVYKHYYNTNNTISKNQIFNVGRAGIYSAFENGSKILGNKIFNVGDRTYDNAAGILAGGEGNTSYDGYHNLNLEIDGNEISNITSNYLTYGIRVEQSRLEYPSPVTRIPDVAENTSVKNNSVWGLYANSTDGSRIGIHLYTTRKYEETDFLTKMMTPQYGNYWTNNDKIVNNTVIMNWDGGMMTSGMIAGVAIQNSKGLNLLNNAIALLDQDVIVDNPMYAAVMYQGQFPGTGKFRSDRNAFWYPANSGASIFRFIETDANSNILDVYSRDEYRTLAQWYQWSKMDMNSVFGNFTTDLVYLGAEPNQKLRVVTTPQPPMGSILNNHGEIIASNTADIDGNTRGSAGQRYDIGASEFTGRMAISDVEALSVTEPGAYKVFAGTFADAEYIMTKAPIEVKAIVRNNGNLQQFGVQCTVKVYLELPNGTFSTSPEISKIAIVDIPSNESMTVAFNLADYQGLNFYPKTYGDLRGLGYVMPEHMKTMEANVTPKYKIEIGVQADQNNTNNIISKVVRFYLMRANTRILLTAENSMTTIDGTSTTDQIAGRLNYDTVMKAFKRFGWKIDIDADPPVYDYDVFDRLGWEPKAVNYRTYRTLVWSDGDDKPITRFNVADINGFLNLGNEIEKKNFISGSQEMVRELSQNNAAQNLPFINGILRAANVYPENPMDVGVDNSGNFLVGVGLERYLTEGISFTGFPNDAPPFCGLMQVTASGEGMAQPAYTYLTRAQGVTDSVAGVATTTLTRNVVHVGVDWRHWNNINMVFRAFIDFVEKNGGTIIPVELLDFNAVAAGNRVDLNWVTASEYNSDRFEIEKANITEAGWTEFAKIATEPASGKSQSVKHYGPISDRNVAAGAKYAYRLKMFDLDGKFDYSKTVEVALDGTGSWLDTPVPNPANTDAKFNWSIAADGMVTISLFDLSGKSVLNIYNGYATAGNHIANVNVSNLTAGTYSIIMTSGTQSFIKQIQVIK